MPLAWKYVDIFNGDHNIGRAELSWRPRRPGTAPPWTGYLTLFLGKGERTPNLLGIPLTLRDLKTGQTTRAIGRDQRFGAYPVITIDGVSSTPGG